MTATVTEIDILTLIDWESEASCSSENCDDKAEWICCPECGEDFLLCISCKEYLVDWAKGAAWYVCNSCGFKSFNIDNLLFRRI